MVSPLAWGMWRLGGISAREAQALVEAALEAGITLFDTADIYGCDTPAGFGSAEALFGDVLRASPGLARDMVIATKGGIVLGVPYDSSAAYLEAALDASLARLGIDQVDLYQIHRRDLLSHPHEVAGALDAMVTAGKVRAVGVSNYSPAELATLETFLGQPLVSTQPEFSALRADPLFDGTLDQAMAKGLAVLAWSPLGGGRLAAGAHPAAQLLAQQAARFGTDCSNAALSWIMAHPAGIIPIVGTQNAERIKATTQAFDVTWTRAEWYAVLEAGMGAKLP